MRNSVDQKFKFQGQEHIRDLGRVGMLSSIGIMILQLADSLVFDPLVDMHVHNSPYAFARNQLGSGVELDGLGLGPFPYHSIRTTCPVAGPGG